ncbi:MAG: hypothetical protein Q9159_005834 [Coniocarpon cinnabarinum]
MSSQTPVWLVTGASSGLGLEIALHARHTGARVVGTVRSRTKSAAAVQKLEAAGVTVVELDTSKGAEEVKSRAKLAEEVYGCVDVLVNNAGYSVVGALEDFDEEESHTILNTNFFGPLHLIQALLPGMRSRQSGTVVNMSSVAGRNGLPSCGLYASSKFALEGLSESLSGELEPFNIRVLLVEPGAFRTNFHAAIQRNTTGLSSAYKNTPVEQTLDLLAAVNGKQVGDPAKAAKAIVRVVGDGCKVDGKRILRMPYVSPSSFAFPFERERVRVCEDVGMSLTDKVG